MATFATGLRRNARLGSASFLTTIIAGAVLAALG